MSVMDEAKREVITRWLNKADNDLRTAETMLTVDPPVTDTACFHAQQCVEKYLKAFLVVHDQHVERTHYLPRLVELCGRFDSSMSELNETAVELTDYAVAGRYPDCWREISVQEAGAAVTKAREAKEFIRRRLAIIDV